MKQRGTPSRLEIIPLNELLKQKNIDSISQAILGGNLLIYPTDTLYGVGGDFFSLKAQERLDELKQRVSSPYSAAVAGEAMIKQLAKSIHPLIPALFAARLLPGPYTFLMEPAPGLDPRLIKNQKKIGIRVPRHPQILKLIKKLSTPFHTTSVNFSGALSLNDPQQIIREFLNQDHKKGVQIMIDAGPLPVSAGSTIIDLTTDPPAITREGDGLAAIKHFLQYNL